MFWWYNSQLLIELLKIAGALIYIYIKLGFYWNFTTKKILYTCTCTYSTDKNKINNPNIQKETK